jgi:DNA-binding response OmpR family regulator
LAPASNVAEETIRVLFVEDDPAVAEMYKLNLDLDGYVVTVVSPDDDATAAGAHVRPELVFVDTQRDENAGLATLRALRAAAPTRNVPVIILSNQHPRQLAASGFQADILDYVVHADLSLGSLSRDVDHWAAAGREGVSA